MELLRWVLFALLLLWIAWFITGGFERDSTRDPFLTPLAPVGSGGTYGADGDSAREQSERNANVPTYIEEVQQILRQKGTGEETIERATKPSIFGRQVSFRSAYAADETDPDKEYIEIRASTRNDQPVTISGWRVKSVMTGKEETIGEGTYLPRAGRVNPEQPIVLAPGARAFLITGRSPIGVSFRSNKCTGYLEQFQDFTPSLSTSCPLAEDNFIYTGTANDDECLDILESLGRCEAYTDALPLSLTGNSKCQEFISRYTNYAGCTDLHKDDSDFAVPVWHIYFGREQTLWKERREMLVLYDNEGKIVDSISY